MFINSLNNFNIRNSDLETEFCEYSKHATLPGIIIMFIVCIPFVAVLSYDLFQLYFYDGYGFTIAYVGSFLAIMLCLIGSHFRFPLQSIKTYAYILFALGYCVLSAILIHSGYRYIGVVMNTMGVVAVLSHCKLKKSTIWITFILLMVTGLICSFTVGGYYTSQVRGKSVNSNYVALFGVTVLVYGNGMLCHLRKKETWKIQLLRLLLVGISFYIIWECQSRGSLLAWLFYTVCVYVLPASIFRNKKKVMIIALLIAITGVVFTYFYVTKLPGLISTFMGKSTATRFRLWSYFWDIIFDNDKNMLLGYGTHSELRELFGYGLHNIYIGIWHDIGLIGLVIFILFILLSLRDTFNVENNLSIAQLYFIVGFLTFMVSDFFAITFTGPMVVWNYALLGLARTAKLDENKRYR